MPNFLKKVAPK